ncbi:MULTISPECIES: hypothetical protein [unclassified Streptomyces]|uniref:hypothetical protein n=1 Tax=unclassified Streptomyces TaxID=2593676 RepID=UPI0035E2666E
MSLAVVLVFRPESSDWQKAYYLVPSLLALAAGLGVAAFVSPSAPDGAPDRASGAAVKPSAVLAGVSVLLVAASWWGFAWVHDHGDLTVTDQFRQTDRQPLGNDGRREVTVDVPQQRSVLTFDVDFDEHYRSQWCLPSTTFEVAAAGGTVEEQGERWVKIRLDPGRKSLGLVLMVRTAPGCFVELDVNNAVLKNN